MKILKVGFDLDGVILYNPLRNFRPFAKQILKPMKATILHQEKENFYLPKSPMEKWLWMMIHKTSFRVNRGYDELRKLAKGKGYEFFLITGRYGFLETDYKNWLKKINAEHTFKACYLNRDNAQPNAFKEKMIKRLKLDFYVEDNWDIIEKLNHHTGSNILWITNFVDRRIPYENKFNDLKEVFSFLKKYRSRRA
ncbi:MAG: hypothetical protein ACOYUB_00910 [Patescibacteria group bacterium]